MSLMSAVVNMVKWYVSAPVVYMVQDQMALTAAFHAKIAELRAQIRDLPKKRLAAVIKRKTYQNEPRVRQR